MDEKKKEPTEDQQIAEIEGEPTPETPTRPEESLSPSTPEPVVPQNKLSFKQKLGRFWHTKKGKATIILSSLAILIVVLYLIPTTRYGILSTIIKKPVSLTVMDSITMKPVTQADVTIGSYTAKTNSKGVVEFSTVPVGQYTLKITKKYYKDSSASYEVPVLGNPNTAPIHLEATGRQTVVSIINRITTAPIAKAMITLSDTSAITDDQGKATLVLPANKQSLKATITSDGYNQTEADIKVGGQTNDSVGLTPSGTLFYLSKQTGKINVMKSNLDGTDAKVVVEGTGSESDQETVLLATRDWKYMALSATRDPKKKGQLYLVDGSTGKLSTIDEGDDVSLQLIGWSNHRFIYSVYRNQKNLWENGQQALKSFDADTGKVSVLEETSATGTGAYDLQREIISNPYIIESKVVYSKYWNFGSPSQTATTAQKMVLISVNTDGTQKQRIREFAIQHNGYIETRVYEPESLYVKVSVDNGIPSFYEYENGDIKTASITDAAYSGTTYPTYLIAPSSKKTFWSESRDGKNTLIVGDANAKNPATLATGSEFTAYGWYTDDYVLLSKNESELYIASAINTGNLQPLKITNYHKPTLRFPGYGTGYGGI